MATYAIGDVQGCFDELLELLNKIKFDQAQDYLWFAGDLVNRGEKSLEVLRFVKSLGSRAITVLGNHDLHLLAVVQGRRKPLAKDRMEAILNAPDRDELCDWLRQQPLMHRDKQLGYVMLHAGLLPQWSLDDAMARAAEVEQVLRGDDYAEFINHMYGNEPAQWSDRLSGWERLRFITNCFTRLRFCDEQGRLELKEKGAPGNQPAGYQPWFELRATQCDQQQILFGHWSTLGMRQPDNVYGLDTGCVWGGTLSALRIDVEPQWSNVACRAICDPGG
ncbi:MAG: symmetrical bis(5'-nucleosyl)-tetraphosphatase [Gammaproteobacteria bacterium]|nr:symmetrical bis(5'-nucleosyl)-tetraphosphatase [Gammaproteobacteria bacterium]